MTGPTIERVGLAIREALEAKDSILETLTDDEIEAAALAALSASGMEEIVGALAGVCEANRDLCFCVDTKGRGLGQCVWCDARAALARIRGSEKDGE